MIECHCYRCPGTETDHAPPGTVLVDISNPGEQRGVYMGCGDRGQTESSVGESYTHPQSESGNVSGTINALSTVKGTTLLPLIYKYLIWNGLVLLFSYCKSGYLCTVDLNRVKYPAYMVKNSKLQSNKSRIRILNIHAYCLTIENAYLTTSVNNQFYSNLIFLRVWWWSQYISVHCKCVCFVTIWNFWILSECFNFIVLGYSSLYFVIGKTHLHFGYSLIDMTVYY